uniref:C-type lectin domain-containing protein n=1 Tax=Anolis carolinensis TaxID=28377 RepID=A0A803TX48_ANOCA|nr:PREDICTED: C-type lectin domain family 2 member D-like [Anolis carolinensis]|eukprot:XP_016852675.1 PREDICTED: C-type lectin domain family 2 member D-like [Anolis carolinensis]
MVNNEDNHETEKGFIPNGDGQPTPEEGIKGLRWRFQHKLLYAFIVLLIIIIVVLGILYGNSRHPTSCPTDWIRYNNKCHYFSNEERNWTSSESFCNQFGASLATIDTEFQELMAHFKLKTINWIGLRRDPGQPQVWKWTNGEISSIEVIGSDGGDCTYLNDEFKPSTSVCNQEHRWICSKAIH